MWQWRGTRRRWIAESSARQDVDGVRGWAKSPDDPLGQVIDSKVRTRISRAGRKARDRLNRVQVGPNTWMTIRT